MARHRAEWWAERLEELAQGGDPEEIARRHRVRTRTLLWWRSHVPRKAREAGKGKPRLLPVVVPTPPRAAILDPALEVLVEVGGMRMTLRGSVAAEHVAAIVTASTRTC
jgi:hypothetical protein